MMIITLQDIKQKFIELIEDRVSRDMADRWAYSMMKEHEKDQLQFYPRKDEKKIWEGIMFLYGIDLPDEPGKYLLSQDDIINFYNKLFL